MPSQEVILAQVLMQIKEQTNPVQCVVLLV